MNSNIKTRNYAIDFIRMVCTLIICLHHFQEHINTYWIQNGQICVEFFFILSGFYLYRTYINNKDMTTIEFTKKRIRRLYPYYIYSLIVIFIVRIFQGIFQQDLDILKLIFGFVSEGLLVQKLGIYENILNWPLWYISVLIFAGIIIFEMLKRDRKKYIYIYSIVIVLLYFNLSQMNLTENCVYGIYMPFLRGLANMTIGCVICSILNKEENLLYNIYQKNKIISYSIEIFVYVMTALIIIKDTPYNNYCIIFFSILIILTNINCSLTYRIFNKKIFKSFGSLTYAMYCNHGAIVLVVAFLYQKGFSTYLSPLLMTFLYLIIVVSYSEITKTIIDKYKNKKILGERAKV